MYQFNNIKSLQVLITQLLKLKALVKCPICLDIVKEPVQVQCTHTFCANCFIELQNANTIRNVRCPLCRKAITTKKSTNYRVEHVAKFVQNVSDKLKTVFDCEQLDANTIDKIISKVKKLQKCNKEDFTLSNQNTTLTKTIPVAVNANNSKKIEVINKQRSSLKQEPCKMAKLEVTTLYEDNLSYSPSNQRTLAIETQNNAFDQVALSLVPTQYKNIKTYRKKKAPLVTYSKLKNFEDGSNKMKIIQWLTDSRNCFDRVTQTQEELVDLNSIETFYLPSISQENCKYMKTYTENLTKLRKSRAELASKSRHERRAQSLDVAIGSYSRSPVFIRHSLACETPDFEEINIEEIESQSDMNDIMHLMEEEYLNTLEMDMNLGQKANETVKKEGNMNLLTGQSIKESTGWLRIKEIKKAINKKERKPKKLNVSFTPVSSKSKSKAEAGKVNSVKKKAVVMLNKLPVDKTKVDKVYNLNEVEAYIEGNILKCNNVALEDVSDDMVYEKTNDIIQNSSENIFKEDHILICNNIVPVDAPNDSVVKNTNENLKAPSLAKIVFNEEENCNSSVSTQEQEETDIRESTQTQVNITKVESKKSPHKITDDVEKTMQITASHNNNFVHPTNSTMQKKEKEHDLVLQEELFMQPTQIITQKVHKQIIDNIEENLEAIFNTQPEKENLDICKRVNEHNDLENNQLILRNKMNLAIKMMNEFNRVVALPLSSLNEVTLHFQKINLVLNEIHQVLEDTRKTCMINSNEFLPLQSPNFMNITLKAKSIFSATTQTVHLDFQDVEIQTDDISHGFRISSTASFKTQQHSQGIETETQTDPFSCTNCNSIVQVNIFSERKPVEMLIHNRDLSKHSADKYEFTQSLDNLQFDTQDIVKDSKCQKKLQLKKVHKAPSPKTLTDKYEFTQSLDNVQINTCDILQGMKGSNVQQTVLLKEIGKDREQISSKSSSSSSNKYKLNTSLDDINFNTNDITGDRDKLNEKLQSDKNKNFKLMEDSAESRLTFSISGGAQDQQMKFNKSLQPLTSSRRFKRIRTLMSDSESDSENPKKVAKWENIRIRNDLSINFISQSSSENMDVNVIKKDDTFALSIGGSENIDYDEYLEKIMKKYDNKIPSSTPKHTKFIGDKHKSKSPKRKASQQIDNPPRDKKLHKDELLTKTKQKDNFSESLFSNRSCLAENVLQDRNAKEPLPHNDTTVNPLCGKKINKDEVPAETKRKDKFSDALFSKGSYPMENLLFAKNIKEPLPHNDIVNSMVDEFKKHLQQNDDELDHLQQSFHGDQTINNRIDPGEKISKITILQNILLHPNDNSKAQSKLPYDLEEELAKMEQNAEDKSEISDDMFVSESEDLDVVETTPQKRNPPRVTQSFQKIKEQIVLPSLNNSPTTALSCLDVTLPPPIEFQDFNADENKTLEDSSDLDVTLVSHIPAMAETLKNSSPNRPSSLLNENIDSSPPSSERLPHFSPIRPERKVLNPLDIVHNSRFTPLNIVIKPQQKLVATSTPKQRSIINYIQISQQSEAPMYSIKSTQHSLEKKPCIACTRLTKEQVIIISTMTNKKLATYSSSYHTGVTHMIVSVNEKNCVKDHTIKFVSAVASGIWVLGFGWIQECLAQNRIVEEEPFEVFDVSGIAGPRTARLTRLEKPLLKGFRIFAAPPFLSTTRRDIEDIVRMLGGEIVSTPDNILKEKGICIIITEARATQDFELYETWLERFNVVTVDIEWISRSVGQYQLLSLRPFALCSDDTMADLGYPPELLVNSPFSFSQSMYSS